MSEKPAKVQVNFREEEVQDGQVPDRFKLLMGESNKFSKAVGLRENLIIDIYKSDSDWAFTIKLDALLEIAVKEIIRASLKLKVLNRFVGDEGLSEFIDGLSMNGRTSLLHLLKASGCPDEELSFVRSVRLIRNAYAHQMKLADVKLIDLIKSRSDKSNIIKYICNINEYKEEDLIRRYEEDGSFLRFAMIDLAMRVLLFSYHIAHKTKDKGKLSSRAKDAGAPTDE